MFRVFSNPLIIFLMFLSLYFTYLNIINHCCKSASAHKLSGLLHYFLPPPPPPPVEVVVTATNVLTEVTFCESVDNGSNLQISSAFQEAGCLLTPVRVNKQFVPKTFRQQKSLTEVLSLVLARGQ